MSKAAIDLRRSQPSLSRQIALLEHRIGAKLFTRTSSGVLLTEAGRVLADSARPILKELITLVDRVGDKATGSVALGTPNSWQSIFTARFATQFIAQYPQVSLRLSAAVSSALRDQMLAGSLDLSIVPFEDAPPKGYSFTALVREPLVLVAPSTWGLSPRVCRQLGDLNGAKLVLPPRPNIVRLRIENSFSRRGLSIETLAEIDTLSLGLELVRAGLACTVAPSCALGGKSLIDGDFSWSPIPRKLNSRQRCLDSSRSTGSPSPGRPSSGRERVPHDLNSRHKTAECCRLIA